MEAIAVFFNIIFDEYRPEGVSEDPLPKKAKDKAKTTTRSTKSGGKKKAKK
jgi:hypothetical protein